MSKAKVILTLITLGMTGCQFSPAGSGPALQSGPINGKFVSACKDTLVVGPQSFRHVFNFSNNQVQVSEEKFSSIGCKNPVGAVVGSGSYQLTPGTAGSGLAELSISIDTRRLNFSDNSFLSFVTSNGFCNLRNLTLNDTPDITNCPAAAFPLLRSSYDVLRQDAQNLILQQQGTTASNVVIEKLTLGQ